MSDGIDVVLDYSFGTRRMRDEYRRLLQPYGVTPTVVYLATPREVVLRRVRERAGDGADAVRLPEEVAAGYFDSFEPPTSDEGPLEVLASS